MAFKTLIAAGFAALTLAFLPVPAAEAKTKVNIGIAIGSPGWVGTCYTRRGYRCGYNSYPHYFYYAPRHRPVYYYDYYDYRRPAVVKRSHKMTCGAAARLVGGSGFNSVRARECKGDVYTFRGRKKGHNYVVKVNAHSRRIIGVARF